MTVCVAGCARIQATSSQVLLEPVPSELRMRAACHAMPCHAMPCHAMPCHASVNTQCARAFARVAYAQERWLALLRCDLCHRDCTLSGDCTGICRGISTCWPIWCAREAVARGLEALGRVPRPRPRLSPPFSRMRFALTPLSAVLFLCACPRSLLLTVGNAAHSGSGQQGVLLCAL